MPRKNSNASSPVKYRQSTLLDMFSSSPSTSRRSRSSMPKRKGKRLPSEELSSGSDIVAVSSSATGKKQERQTMSSRFEKESNSEHSDDSDLGRIKFEERTSSVHSAEEEEADDGPSTQVRHAKRRRLLASDSEEELVSEDNDTENQGVGLTRPRSSRAAKVRVIDSDSDAQPGVTSKRRLVKGVRPPSDEEDIMDGIQEDKIMENRFRGKSSKQTEFLKNLEKLKKKKRGEAVMSSDESEGEAFEEDADAPIPGARPNWDAEEGEDQDENIDDFIVEDDGNVQVANLPAAFSMNTHQDLVHHFKIVCQYHVHLAVADDHMKRKVAKRLAEDEYFSVPLTITRRKLADLQDTIASSVWRPAYKKALQKFPDFNLTDLDFAIPQCDACRLGGRMSKFMARLSGPLYDKTTFETLEAVSSDSDDEEGHLSRELHLGRWCAQRTEIFHELCHWELRLSENILREVKELRKVKRGSSRITYACEPPEDAKNGDEVMDWLDRREIITLEWTMVKALITRATNLDAEVKRGKAVD